MLLPKIWIICRVCLKQQREMLNIFDDKNNKSVWTLLRDCGGVPVRRDDNLPDKICGECLGKLWKASTFRTECQRGHRELVQMLMERAINLYELALEDEKKLSNSEILTISDRNLNYTISSPTFRPESLLSCSTFSCDDSVDSKAGDLISIDDKSLNSSIKQYCIVSKNNNKEGSSEEITTKATCNNRKEPIVLLLKLKNKTEMKNQAETIKKDEETTKTEYNLRTKKEIATKGGSSVALNQNDLKTNEKGKLKRKSNKINNTIKGNSMFSCKICKKSFTSFVLLRHHLYVHNRPHQCKICKKRFSQIQAFLCHNNLHSGIKPYYCRFCYKTFADISNRNSHERKQHKNENFKCEKCNKIFRFLSLYRKHTYGHKPKRCLICNKDFSSIQMVRKHHQYKHLKLLNNNQ
ncbi:uncharacterized protein ACRADG_010541 [Cochliomyia hominivorax]